ncbi:SAM-dependent methyltransferase [Pseudomonas zeae]
MNPLPLLVPLTGLNLLRAIFVQAGHLLLAIREACSIAETLRAADRAEGFVLGVQTTRGLSPASLEVLQLAFETASRARQKVIGQ